MNELQGKKTFTLLLFSLVSFALSFATAIFFARALGADGYDDYAVAISTSAILTTLAEMGTGKFAMRIIPVFVVNKQWSQAKGYGRFAAGLILATSVGIALIVAASEFYVDGKFGNYALGVVILFLPAMAWLGAGAEFLTANQAAVRAAFIMRLLLPASTLAFAVAWNVLPFELTAPRGVLCYGSGSVVGLAAVWLLLRQATPRETFAANAEYQPKDWFTGALPFLAFALLLTVLAKVGVIVLEIVYPQESMVAVYSAAVDTGTFIYFVAKSTDKLFLPEISLMIERKDAAELRRMRRWRWAWMGAVCGTFLSIVVMFGRRILSLFGEEFIKGYPALCIIAFATSVWTMASISPTYLKYVNKNKFVVIATGLTVAAHIALCFPLGRYFGATGAALSYAIPVMTLYVTLSFVANRHLRHLNESDIETTASLSDEDRDEFSG